MRNALYVNLRKREELLQKFWDSCLGTGLNYHDDRIKVVVIYRSRHSMLTGIVRRIDALLDERRVPATRPLDFVGSSQCTTSVLRREHSVPREPTLKMRR